MYSPSPLLPTCLVNPFYCVLLCYVNWGLEGATLFDCLAACFLPMMVPEVMTAGYYGGLFFPMVFYF